MRPRVPRVLLLIVAIVRFSTTTSSASAQQSQLLILRLLPEKPVENPDGTPSKWRTVQNGEYRAPQMEIHLLKDRVSPEEKWYYLDDNTEYKYFGPNYNSATDEKEVYARLQNDEKPRENAREDEDGDADDLLDSIVMPDRIVPPIDFRNIIVAPTFCPDGERPDSRGRCRPVLELLSERRNGMADGGNEERKSDRRARAPG